MVQAAHEGMRGGSTSHTPALLLSLEPHHSFISYFMEILLLPFTNVLSATLLLPALLLLLPANPTTSQKDINGAFYYMGLVPCFFFYAVSFLYFLLDMLPSATWRASMKMQHARNLPTLTDYTSAFLVSLRSWFVGLCYILLLCRTVGPSLGTPLASSPWSPLDFFFHLPVYILAVDVCFFTTHRILHTPHLYASVHKFHHTYTAPFAIAAVYTHPFEHLFSNVLSISLGPLIMRSHPISAAVWGCLASLSTLNSHSGFNFPFTTDGHDWHHREFTENYGAGLMLFDRFVFGTNSKYKAFKKAEGEKAGKSL